MDARNSDPTKTSKIAKKINKISLLLKNLKTDFFKKPKQIPVFTYKTSNKYISCLQFCDYLELFVTIFRANEWLDPDPANKNSYPDVSRSATWTAF